MATHSGDHYIASEVTADENISRRICASVVEDSKTGQRYLKLVNALPVSLTLTIEGAAVKGDMPYEGFEGNPKDQKVTTQKGTTTSGTLVLPPYSFRVFVM